jgi:hypothetical protein
MQKWGQIFILDIADASMRLLPKKTESKVKDKDLTPITTYFKEFRLIHPPVGYSDKFLGEHTVIGIGSYPYT